MNHLSPISEVSLRVEAGSSSSERLPFLPAEIVAKIFSWLTHTNRHQLYQSLLEKQVNLESKMNQTGEIDLKILDDFNITLHLKRAVELADQENWKPFQDFINNLAQIVIEIEEGPLKAELSSLLTNLIELNCNTGSVYEKEADLFVALFNLTPPALNHLCAYFGEEHPFIEKTLTYRNFGDQHPTLETRNQKFTDWVRVDHFFPAHKIFPLLDRNRQFYCGINMIYACCSENTLTKIHRDELIFFAKKVAELEHANLFRIFRTDYLLLALQSLLHAGYLQEATELSDMLPHKLRGTEINGCQSLLFAAANKTIQLYAKELEEEMKKPVIQYKRLSAIEDKIFAIIQHLIHEEFNLIGGLINSLSYIRDSKGSSILSGSLMSRIFNLEHAVYPFTDHSAHDCLCTIL